MKTIKELLEPRQWGAVAKMARDNNINIRTLARWLKDESHYVDDQGYVYKKVGKLNELHRSTT